MLNLLRTAGLAMMVANLKRKVRALVVKAALGAVALVLLLYAILFGLMTAAIALARAYGPIWGAGIVAIVLLVLAIVFAIVASYSGGGGERHAASNPAEQLVDAAQQGYRRLTAAAAESEAPWKNPVLQLAGAAFLVGLIFGRRTRR